VTHVGISKYVNIIDENYVATYAEKVG